MLRSEVFLPLRKPGRCSSRARLRSSTRARWLSAIWWATCREASSSSGMTIRPSGATSAFSRSCGIRSRRTGPWRSFAAAACARKMRRTSRRQTAASAFNVLHGFEGDKNAQGQRVVSKRVDGLPGGRTEQRPVARPARSRTGAAKPGVLFAGFPAPGRRGRFVPRNFTTRRHVIDDAGQRLRVHPRPARATCPSAARSVPAVPARRSRQHIGRIGMF